MEQAEQQHAAKALADLESLNIVIAAPVPPRRQERARVECLEHLVPELRSFEVDTLYLEACQPSLNKRDERTVARIRQHYLPKGARFRVTHVRGADAVELWNADVVAGVCRAAHEGRPELREILADRIYDIDIRNGA